MTLMKSALLASATTIIAVASAQAADLPSKKAAPVSYVKVCDAYGAGFFYIPGTDTCVKLGGYVRAEYQYTPGKDVKNLDGSIAQSKKNQAETGYEVRGRVDVDARRRTIPRQPSRSNLQWFSGQASPSASVLKTMP